MQVAMRPMLTIQQCLMNPKNRIPNLQQTGVIYFIRRKDCEVKYIGETDRELGTTRKERHSSVNMRRSRAQL